MKKGIKIIAIIVILLSIILYVEFRVQKYNKMENNKNLNPTQGMSTQETIDFYFDIEISDKKLIKEEYVNNGCVAYKIDVSSLTDTDIASFAKGYEESQYENYNWEEGGNPFDDIDGVDWWHINKDNVKKSFEKLASPKRDIGALTASYRLFFVKENDETFLYMIYTD